MSENLEIQLAKLIDKAQENAKRTAWAGFGVALYHSDLRFQLIAQSISGKLINPKDTSEIEKAEEALALAKKEHKKLVDERIAITTARFEPVTKRLMTPEKEVLEAFAKNEAEILKAKKQREQEAKTKENKEKELREVAEKVRVYVADMHSAYLNAQLKLISDSYKHALNNFEKNTAGDVFIVIPSKADNATTSIPFSTFLSTLKGRVTLLNRKTPPPKITAQFNTQDAVDEEIKKWFKPWSPQQYVDGFIVDVDKKYEDWDLAMKNKETALELNENEEKITTVAINEQKEQETVAAKLEAIATPIADVAVKEIKRPWKIKEPETIDEAFNILNAFVINRKLTQPELSKIKPINLSIKQMMGALESIKEKDEKFSFTGIVFSQIEKL